MQGFKLIYISKRGPRNLTKTDTFHQFPGLVITNSCSFPILWKITSLWKPHDLFFVLYKLYCNLHFLCWFPHHSSIEETSRHSRSTGTISNYIHHNMCDEITYPFPNFNGEAIEVWEWICNFITLCYSVCGYLSMPGFKLNHVSQILGSQLGSQLDKHWFSVYLHPSK